MLSRSSSPVHLRHNFFCTAFPHVIIEHCTKGTSNFWLLPKGESKVLFVWLGLIPGVLSEVYYTRPVILFLSPSGRTSKRTAQLARRSCSWTPQSALFSPSRQCSACHSQPTNQFHLPHHFDMKTISAPSLTVKPHHVRLLVTKIRLYWMTLYWR